MGRMPSPSWPPSLPPQQRTPPLCMRAQTWVRPAVRLATPVRMSVAAGLRRSTARTVSSPIWPWSLEPQQRTPPAVVSAQVWALPAAIALTPEIVGWAAGAVRAAVDPLPRRPLSPEPQQRTLPSVPTTQACDAPTATATAFETTSAAGGADRSVLLPSPSWPVPLEPQQRRPPAVVIAQVSLPPAATLATAQTAVLFLASM